MPVIIAFLALLIPSLAWGGTVTLANTVTRVVGSGTLTQTAPTRTAGDLLLAYTEARLSTETLTQSWGTVLASFSGGNGHLICRIATNTSADDISWDWSGTSTSSVQLTHWTGDVYDDCATIVAHSAVRTSGNSAGFPYEALTVTTDDTLVLIVGQKTKTTTTNGATINAEAGFTEISESGPNGTESFRVWNYVQQTTATNITAGDWDFTGTTETQTARGFTVALRTATAVADGVNITSIGAGSICETLNASITPDIAVNDNIIIDSTVVPGGFALTVGADCQLSFPANGLRQQATLTIYDDSAAALMTGSTTVYFGNQPPAAVQADYTPVLLTGSAMTAVDFADFFTDFEGDTLTCTNDNGGVGSGNNLRPTGTAISGCDWTGTPTTAQAGNFTVTATDVAGDTATIEIVWETFAPLSFSSVNTIGTEDGYIILAAANADATVCAVATYSNLAAPSGAQIVAGQDVNGSAALADDCETVLAGEEAFLLLDGLALPRYRIDVVAFDSPDYSSVTSITGLLKAPASGTRYIEVVP